MVSQEMTVWERSKMWPFSCYAYAKETDCLPGRLSTGISN